MFPAPNQPTEKLSAWLGGLTNEELLDRFVFCRDELTPVGLEATRRELEKRRLDPARQDQHRQAWENRLWRDARGHSRTCHRCHRLATSRAWSFRKIFRLIPIIPIRVGSCPEHGG